MSPFSDNLPQRRHLIVCLHGVRVAPGYNESWLEEFEARAQPLFQKRVEIIARNYAGLIFNKIWASATWMPLYRRIVVGREDDYFKALRRRAGPGAFITVIAHSFGGYIVGELLKRGHVFHRVVLIAPAADSDFDWRSVEENFGLVSVCWSPRDEIIPFAYYGKMGAEGPTVLHARVQEWKTDKLHNEWFTEPSFTALITHAIGFIES